MDRVGGLAVRASERVQMGERADVWIGRWAGELASQVGKWVVNVLLNNLYVWLHVCKSSFIVSWALKPHAAFSLKLLQMFMSL